MIGIRDLSRVRATRPEAIAQALKDRAPGVPAERELIIACDHPARGAIGAGGNPLAMAHRAELLERCQVALSRPGVTGFLGTADLIEDLTLLGALEGKQVFGSMNRIGIRGACFEMDDRFAAMDATGIQASHLDGGKILLRINLSDPATALTLEAAGRAVNELAAAGKRVILEPFLTRWEDGRAVNDLGDEAMSTVIAIASGLGRTSAHTWLKLPALAPDTLAATTLPVLILGGEVGEQMPYEAWASALAQPNVRGLVVGRSLLFPPDDDVARAVDNAVELL